MSAYEDLRGQPNSPEYELSRIDHHENITMLDESRPLFDYKNIPPGGGFMIVEKTDSGLQRLEFYRDIKLGDEIDSPNAPEWYVVAGEGDNRMLWPVILHGSTSPNGFTNVEEIREDMPFMYQAYVAFDDENDAPAPDRFVRPEEYEKQPLPKPSNMDPAKRAEYIMNSQIIHSEDGELRWFLPGVLFMTGPIKHVD